MKGFLLSTLVFVLYVVLTALVSHIFRVQRHSKLFVFAAAVSVVVYLGGYWLSPGGLGFLPPEWTAHFVWLDLLLGLFILVLNIHNYVDWFFGFNGGFSTSLILLLHRAGNAGRPSGELIANYHGRDGMDKIYGWRLPRLEETGYIKIDKQTSHSAR